MDRAQFNKGRTLVLSVLLALLPSQIKAEAEREGCEQAAQHQLQSCRQEAQAAFWTEVAKADHLPTREERREAIDDAREELGATLQDCKEQRRARIDLCEELEESIYHPSVDPADFEVGVPNPYFPIEPGVTRVYSSETADGTEEVVTTVTDATREILGVVCVVIHDVVYLEGDPIEDTLDYYANDASGNVWYMGEDSVEIENGIIVSVHGSWIAGVDGAKPGIIMKATPLVGDVYRQEFAAGDAEDAARVVSLSEEVTVPFGTFMDCLQTEDFTPVEPGFSEYKYYAPGVGAVLEVNPETGEELVLIDVMFP